MSCAPCVFEFEWVNKQADRTCRVQLGRDKKQPRDGIWPSSRLWFGNWGLKPEGKLTGSYTLRAKLRVFFNPPTLGYSRRGSARVGSRHFSFKMKGNRNGWVYSYLLARGLSQTELQLFSWVNDNFPKTKQFKRAGSSVERLPPGKNKITGGSSLKKHRAVSSYFDLKSSFPKCVDTNPWILLWSISQAIYKMSLLFCNLDMK